MTTTLKMLGWATIVIIMAACNYFGPPQCDYEDCQCGECGCHHFDDTLNCRFYSTDSNKGN